MGQVDNVALTGIPADVDSTVLNAATGWNWIGFTPQLSQEVNNALLNIPENEGVYLKSQSEYADYYSEVGWFGTLETMYPYLGYQIQLNSPVDFVYNNQNFSSSHAMNNYDDVFNELLKLT